MDDEPVQACPPSAAYRFRKFFKRHKALVTTTALVCLTAIIGTAASLWYARQATIAAGQAKFALSEAEQQTLKAQQATEQSQLLLYAADMKLASDAIANQDVARAAELLTRHLPSTEGPDSRGFEWFFQHKRIVPPQNVTLSQAAWVDDIEVSPDGRWLAATAANGTVQIYETGTWHADRLLTTQSESVNGLAWSPDGAWLAAACDDGHLVSWSFANGAQRLFSSAHEGGANDVVFSPDGLTLYSCGEDYSAKAWNIESGELRQTFNGHQRAIVRTG